MSFKIRREVKEKWLADLRSGKFRQGAGQLRRYLTGEARPEHCCLGVLTEQHGTTFNDDAGYPHAEVLEWAGVISCENEDYAEDQLFYVPTPADYYQRSGRNPGMFQPKQVDLAQVNDAGYTFAEIADLIEAHAEVID